MGINISLNMDFNENETIRRFARISYEMIINELGEDELRRLIRREEEINLFESVIILKNTYKKYFGVNVFNVHSKVKAKIR